MRPPADFSAAAEPLKLLLVGNDLDELARIREVLEQIDIASQLEITTDCQLALEWLRTNRHDVCLLDSRLRGVAGIDLLQRAREAGCHIPIIMLTCSNDSEDEQAARRAGAFDYLHKHHLLPKLLSCSLHHAINEANHIQQLKQQQEALRQTHHQLEMLKASLNQHAIVSEADRSGAITAVNELFCEISGYSREELIGQNHRLLKSGEHPAEFYRHLWSTISSGQTWHGEICNRSKSGDLYWVQGTIVPFLDDNGRPYRYISIRTNITAQKQSEAALRLSAHAVRASASGIVILKADPTSGNPITYANPAIGRMTGYTPDELLGQNIFFLQSAATDSDAEDKIRLALLAGQPIQQVLLSLRHKSGSLFWCEISASPVFDEAGRATHYVAVANDVTARKAAEDALHQSDERLRRSQSYANIGTWDWNIQSGELFWSERIAPLFGYQGIVETSYENFLDAVYPDDRQQVLDAIAACIEQGEKYQVEHRTQWPDGSIHWLLEQGDVTRLADGTPSHMLGVVQDITTRKEISERLRASQASLNNAQRIARMGSWDLDLHTDILHCSDQIYTIFGLDPAQDQLSVANFNTLVHPDDVDLMRVSAELILVSGSCDLTYRILLQDGGIRYLHALFEADFDEKGQPCKLSGMTQDITDQILREEALRLAKQEAEQANQAKSEFLSSMSHELRTPMNAILGFAQLLQLRRDLSAEQQQDVTEILKAGRHLLELINEVLDLAKIEAGALSLSLEPILCCEVIDESLKLLQPMAEHHGIQLREDPRQLCFVWFQADRTRLKQVLINLLSNAIKYNRPQGSVTLRIAKGTPGYARIEVADTGFGIPPEALPLLFQPFQRLDAADKGIEGTGIGLAICKRLIESMGGKIGVESIVDAGSIFWLELPMVESGAVSAQHVVETQNHPEPVNMATATLLYVEDNPANMRLLEQIVATRPAWQLLSAHTPELGLELSEIHADTLDVILLDINLPGMNGYQVLKQLQSNPVTADIPVIALSANAMPNDIKRGITAGFLDYLVKPIEVAQLLRLLDEILEQRHQAK